MRPADRDAIAAVQRCTLFLGGPLPWPVQDLEALVHYWVDYYALCEPEAGVVVESDDGRVIGYRAGSIRRLEQSRWQQREALRLGALWARHWRTYDAATRCYYRLRLRDTWDSLRDPPLAVDGEFHWNVLPEVRGRVVWAFLRQYRDWLAARGLRTIGGRASLVGPQRSDAGWRRLGFDVQDEGRHHTLSVLSGRPVARIAVRADIEALRV
jgi:hypothetical protein